MGVLDNRVNITTGYYNISGKSMGRLLDMDPNGSYRGRYKECDQYKEVGFGCRGVGM